VKMCLSLRCCVLLSILVAAFAAESLGEGLHEKQAVPETPWTFDAYIPPGYKAHPERKYPTLFLSRSTGNPKVDAWRSFADENGFIIVGINDSKDGLPWSTIDKIQTKTLAAVANVIRVHRVLRYSSGTSHAGWCSIRLAMRNQKTWAGVQVSAHSGNGDYAGKGVAMGMFAGKNDTTHKFDLISATVESYKAKGNPVRFIEYDGANIPDDLDDVMKLVLFCYRETLLASPHLSKEERVESAKILQEKIDELLKLPDPQEIMQELNNYLRFAGFAESQQMKAVAPAWLKNVRASGALHDDEEGKPYKLFSYGLATTSPYFAVLSKEHKQLLFDEMAVLKNDPAVNEEAQALEIYLQLISIQRKVTDGQKVDAKMESAYSEMFTTLTTKFRNTHCGLSVRIYLADE
jgi:hypothetical protein